MLAGQLPYDLGDGKIASAIRAIEESEPRSLSAVSRNLRGDLETIGRTYDKLGAFEDAERHLRSAVADFEAQAGPLDERALMTTARLGLTLSQLDRLEEAEALLNQAQQRLEGYRMILKVIAVRRPQAARARSRLVERYVASGKAASAAQWRDDTTGTNP